MTEKMNAGFKKKIRIGFAGLDNSRALVFAKLLQDSESMGKLAEASLAVAWPGVPSPDFAMSFDRYNHFLEQLRDFYRIPIIDQLSEAADHIDAWMIEAVDGRGREALFRDVISFGKPVFVDKPLALESEAAQRMMRLAKEQGVPVMSCSALRYSHPLAESLADHRLGDIVGADFYGPMALEETQLDYYWYGIHTAEMLFRVLGPECTAVTAQRTGLGDILVAEWSNGRLGTIRGSRFGNDTFGGVIHRARGSQAIVDASAQQPYLHTLLEEVVTFFQTGISPIASRETTAIIRFLEAANESARLNKRVELCKI